MLTLRRHDEVLLCIVRWALSESPAKSLSLAEVSLTETAVCCRDYPCIEIAWEEMEQRCPVPTMCEDAV